MKLLIQNYSNSCSSQPMYFNECLSRAKVESKLWDLNDPVSVYDKLDLEKPDIIIASFQTVRQEILSYLKSNNSMKIVFDITGINQDILDNLELLIENEHIDCPFFISQDYKFLTTAKAKKTKTINLLPSCDIFGYQTPVPDFHVQAAVISNKLCDKFTESCEHYESYHKVLLADNPDPSFDLQANVINMNSLYQKYDEIVLTGDVNFTCSQVFFDGFVKSKKLTVKVPDEQKDLFNQVLATLFYEEGNEPSLENIKSQIIKNHTCFTRSSQLASALGDKIASEALAKVAEQL